MGCGVLALQGDWQEHAEALQEVGVTASPVRTEEEFGRVDALILPGGESTAMLRLMAPDRLDVKITERIAAGMPVLATCAGLILLARGIVPQQPSLAMFDVDVVRNAYGRQVHSTVDTIEVEPELGEPAEMEAVFIRAPRVARVGADVRVLGRRRGDPVLMRQGRILAATFHPELTRDRRVHRLFCQIAGV